AASRRRALDIAVAGFGAASPQAIAAMLALARLELDRGRPIAAEGLLLAALANDESPPAAAYIGLAEIAAARRVGKAAEVWARRAAAAPVGDAAAAVQRALGLALAA